MFNRKMHLINKGENIVRLIDHQLNLPTDKREKSVTGSFIENELLWGAERWLKNLIKMLRTEELPNDFKEYIPEYINNWKAGYSFVIIDSWPSGTKLGNKIQKYEAQFKMYLRLNEWGGFLGRCLKVY